MLVYMYKNIISISSLTFLVIVIISFSTVFSLTQGSTDLNPQTDIPNITQSTSIPVSNDIGLDGVGYNNISALNFGLNATSEVNRTMVIENYGTLALSDSIELRVIGNENLTYFNYTLPNIHTENITFASFRVANATYDDLLLGNATRTFTFSSLINYTTFVIPFYEDKTAIHQGDVYFINTYIEFSLPYTYQIADGEQLTHYEELLYPLINNVPIVNGTVTVIKQGGDLFIDNTEFPILPGNSTADITVINDASTGSLKWSNITRIPFNYTQSYSEDLLLSIHFSSVSTVEDQSQASTLLFKASNIERTVEIDPFGIILVTEVHRIDFLGAGTPEGYDYVSPKLYALNSFPIVLPKNATVKDLYDDMGSLNTAYQLNEEGYFERGSYNVRDSTFTGHQALLIFPRSPLFNGESTTFTLVYQVEMSSMITKEQGSTNYKLKLLPSSIINWTVDNLDLDIILPKGAVVRGIQYTNPDPYQDITIDYNKKFLLRTLGFKRILSFSFTEFSGSDNAPIIIEYTYSMFNMWITFFWQFMVVGLVIAAIIGIRWSVKRVRGITEVEKEKEHIPVDEIEDFVKQYEEVSAIKERLRETRAKIASKKLKAKEGKELRTKLEKRLRAEEETLKGSKATLSALGGRYKESVQRIEIAERKLFEERRNLRALQQEYRTKKSMTKESYMKLFRERQQTIEKLKNEIDGLLLELRMLLED